MLGVCEGRLAVMRQHLDNTPAVVAVQLGLPEVPDEEGEALRRNSQAYDAQVQERVCSETMHH